MHSPSPRIWPVAVAAGLLLLSATGCVARVGSDLSVPPDAANICVEQCGSIGLGMSAVAIMANNVGCVCQPRARTGDTQAGGTGATAGMVTIMLEEQERQRQQAAQQRTR